MADVSELRVALTVADFDQAVAFYRDALGLEQVADWSSPDGRVVLLEAGRATLEARLSMTPVLWGTRLDLTCSYGSPARGGGVPYPHAPAWGSATYALVVETAAGAEQQVATWRAVPGRTLHLSGATSWTPRDIAEVEVRAADGTPVLTLEG